MRSLSSVLGALVIGLLLACDAGTPSPESGGAPVSEISQQSLLNEPPEGAIILDVRTPEEFSTGHVPNATNIPHDALGGRLGELGPDKHRDIVVYCKSGRRAGLATEVLAEAGFTRLHHLAGDMDGWRAAGLSVE